MKRLFLFICLVFTVFSLSAQWEVGVLGGVSNYQGDLSPSKTPYSVGPSHAAFGAFTRYNPHRLISARFGINYSTVSGDDAKSKDASRKRRNLSFKSTILEFSLVGEFNILGYQAYNLAEVFTPYLFGGVAGFIFNPQALYEGEYYDLQPVGTEGQGLAAYPDRQPYRLTEFAIPAGIGFKYAINDKWNLGLEVGGRKTFTDHLDDVSGSYANDSDILESKGVLGLALANRTGQSKSFGDIRGSATGQKIYADWYYTTAITISYNFSDNGLVGSRGRSKKGKKGCPTNF